MSRGNRGPAGASTTLESPATKDQYPRSNVASPHLRHRVTAKYRDLLDTFSTPASRAQALFDPRLH